MICGGVGDNSPDNKNATRDALRCLQLTSGYSSVTSRNAAERPQDMPGQHRDASGCLKDTLDGFKHLADIHGWGLRIFTSLADVSLSIRIFY